LRLEQKFEQQFFIRHYATPQGTSTRKSTKEVSGGFTMNPSEAGQLQFFGPDFAIWQGFRRLDGSLVDWKQSGLKVKFEECPLYFF